MWIVMYLSYMLMGVSFFLLALTGLMGYFNLILLTVNHIQVSLIASIVYMFTETLIMFYFIITGKKIKEYIYDNQCEPEMYSNVIRMKMKLFPHVTINMIIFGAQFILGGAVHNGSFPGWAHGLMFDLAILHFIWVIIIQHNCFKENTELVISLYRQIKERK